MNEHESLGESGMSSEEAELTANRMGLEEAQADANLMRAKLTELYGREPTSEDYSKTSQWIEELKKLAEDEPTFKKVFLKILQINSKYLGPEGLGMNKLIEIITMGKFNPYKEDEKTFPGMKRPWDDFDNAAERLRKLKEKAEKIGQDQLRHSA